jgi:hypothetical protein
LELLLEPNVARRTGGTPMGCPIAPRKIGMIDLLYLLYRDGAVLESPFFARRER